MLCRIQKSDANNHHKSEEIRERHPGASPVTSKHRLHEFDSDLSHFFYIIKKEDLRETMEDLLSNMVDDRVYNRFEGVLADTNMVCTILSVTKVTLYKYIDAGIIPFESREGRSEYKFRLSDILKIDLKELRRRMRYNLIDINKKR